MTAGFLTDWLSGQVDVNGCVGDAVNNGRLGAHMDSSVQIYGAYDLMRNTRTRP